MRRDEKKMTQKGKIDLTKIPKGHQAHRSGAGQHKNWRLKSRQSQKLDLKNEAGALTPNNFHY